jgi:hypothetical protein
VQTEPLAKAATQVDGLVRSDEDEVGKLMLDRKLGDLASQNQQNYNNES